MALYSRVTAFINSRGGVFIVAAVYLMVPGHPDAFFKGIPLGLWPSIVLAAGTFAWFFFRGTPELRRGSAPLFIALACLSVVKGVAALAGPPVGWLGRYYPNDRFEGRYRRSTEFPHLDATRIDRTIDFVDDAFPVYFLNEADFNRNIRREVTFPVTATWTGYVTPAQPTALALRLRARGHATVAVDGGRPIEVDSRDGSVVRSETVALAPGDHRIDVTYLKPADTDPLIALGLDAGGDDAVVLVTPRPSGSSPWLRFRAAAFAGRSADALAAVAFAVLLWRLATAARVTTSERSGQPASLARGLCAVMFALLLVQAGRAALPHVHRAVSLSGGDDWLAFEARAREVLTGGPLMRFGQPLGKGEVFYYYPGYSYFLAGVHWVTGEDLSGPILANFLLLFLANIVSYRIAAAVFGDWVAIPATALLVGIEQIAFVRNYTPVLLSENLYFLTVPLTVLGLVRFLQSGRRASLAWAGLAAGASAITRPAMMLYLVPAVLLLAIADMSPRPARSARAASIATFLAGCFGVVLLVTLRNYVVAGSPTLISETPAHSFILYNLPATADAGKYMKMYSGGLFSAASVLIRIFIDHPLDLLSGVTTKIGFSFGMLPWMGGNFHPELLLASGLYFGAIVFSRAARAPMTWPIHAFIAVHLVGMVLTMPSNYGYRLILPMYLFLPMFGPRLVMDVMASFGGSASAAQPSRRVL